MDILKEMENKDIQTDLDLQAMKADSKAAIETSSKKAAGITGNSAEDTKRIDGLLDINKIRYKNKPKTRSDSESAHNTPGHPPRPQEFTDTDKFNLNLKEALEAINLNNFVRATGKYEAALALWNQSDEVKSLCRADQIVVVRYAYGITALSQEGGRTLFLDSLQIFRSMYRHEVHTSFPLVLYGLRRAYIALYRFAEALKVVDMQLTKEKKKAWNEVCWPASHQAIEESKLSVFIREMAKLKELCQFPPQADAICFEHIEHDEAREIYKLSPTYTGMVTMSCYAKCSFMFHITCWKEYKGKFCADKISDKEMIQRLCPTPDCGSFISSIILERLGKEPHKFVSQEKVVKPLGNHKIGRMKLSNPDKIAKRKERKEIKRQKQLEAHQKSSPPGSPILSHSNKQQTIVDLIKVPYSHHQETEIPAVPLTGNAMVVLNKEGEQDDKYNTFQKQVRQKKKKQKEDSKNKNVLSLDFNFTDDMEREANRVGEQEALEAEDTAPSGKWEKPPRLIAPVQTISSTTAQDDNVFVVPPYLREQCESFSNIVAKKPSRSPSQVQREEEIKNTFNGYMFDFLREAGPQHLQSQRMLQELEDIPEEVNRVIKQCGGIHRYFEMNEVFFVAGQCVGIEADAEKVCRMADNVTSEKPVLSTSSIANTNPSLGSRPSIANSNIYSSNKPAITNGVIVEPGDNDVHRTNSQTLNDYLVRTEWTDSLHENSMRKAAVNEMAFPPPPASNHGLNPSAPEFQPGGILAQDRQGSAQDQLVLPKDYQRRFLPGQEGAVACVDTDEECSPTETSMSHHGISTCYANLDSLDAFTPGGIDDIDDYDFNEMDKIDEADINPAPSGNDYMDLEDLTGEHSSVVPEPISRRSSKSDLSQTSDFSTSGLFRGASPSSSASSHKGTSKRDMASPFSARDTSSPGFPGSRTAESLRRTSSPGAGSSLHAATGLDAKSSELGLGAGFAAGVVLSSHNGDHLPCNSLSGGDFSIPKPLKPLAPIGNLVTSVVDNGFTVVSSGAGKISTIPTSDSFLPSSSFLNQPSLSSSSGFTGGFPSLSSSNTWGSSSSSGSTWPTNTFPSAVRPEEEVVNSIPPFPTSHLFSQSSSSTSSLHLLPQPSSVSFPGYSSSSWSTGKVEDWMGGRVKMEKVEQGTQAGVDVRSVEVNTELTGYQLTEMLVHQQQLLQRLQHLHALYTQSKQEANNAEEEKIAARRECEELRGDLNKAVMQLGNLETECGSIREKYAECESQLRGLQEQNKMSAMETNNLLQKVSHLEGQINKEHKRAKHAEIQVIQEQMENFKIHLDMKIKDCEVHRQQAANNIQSFQEAHPGLPVPKHLEEGHWHAQKVVECWANKKVDIMRQLKEQQELIMAGKLQSELPSIHVYPNLPPHPDDLVVNNNVSSSQPAGGEPRQHTPPQPSSSPAEELFTSNASSSSFVAAVASVAQPRLKGPPGLSALREPAPLRPPLGLPFPARPAVTQTPSFTDPAKTQAAPPPPLRPISTSKIVTGALQPRNRTPPLASQPSALKPVGVAATVPLRPAGSGVTQPPQSSFSKMVAVLQKSFPHCDREQFSRAVQELRQAHNGSLTGLDLEFIVRHVTNMLIARGFKPQPHSSANQSSSISGVSSSKGTEVKRTAPPPGLSAAWSVEGLEPLAGDPFLEEEDPCAICHEELSFGPVQTLECAHRFHDQCIRTWFKQQTTCPKCRTYAPLLDDFPTLK